MSSDLSEIANESESDIIANELTRKIEAPCFTRKVSFTLDLECSDEVKRKLKEIEIPEGRWHFDRIERITNLSNSETCELGACIYQIVIIQQYMEADVVILKFRNVKIDPGEVLVETMESDKYLSFINQFWYSPIIYNERKKSEIIGNIAQWYRKEKAAFHEEFPMQPIIAEIESTQTLETVEDLGTTD